MILGLKSFVSRIMPLFSSSSPFDQDVGKIQRIISASLVKQNTNECRLISSLQRKPLANSTQQMTGSLLWKYAIVFHVHRVGKEMFFLPNFCHTVCRRS